MAVRQPTSPIPSGKKAHVTDFDRRLGAAIRSRRILLGLSQQELAELIGVTYQQAHKYEKGINRIASARLLDICRALSDWPVAECLAAAVGEPAPQVDPSIRQRMDAAALFGKLSRRKAAAVVRLMRALAEPEGGK
jgi:transcriptional regulator with XRE-family HTH domain